MLEITTQTTSPLCTCPTKRDVIGAPAFVALGSNLDSPAQQVQEAFAELARIPGIALQARSSLYRTAPIGYTDQPDFINAVAGPRTLDLDLSADQGITRLPALVSDT